MAQVSLGEVLSSPDARAFSAINSKRVDLLIVSRRAIRLPPSSTRDTVTTRGRRQREMPSRKRHCERQGSGTIEVAPESGTEAMVREISRIAQLNNLLDVATKPLQD